MEHKLTKIAIAAGAGAAVVAPMWFGYKLVLRASQLVLLPLVGVVVYLGMTYVPPAIVHTKLSAAPAFTQEEHDKAVQAAIAKHVSDNLKREGDIKTAVDRAVSDNLKREGDTKAIVDSAVAQERLKAVQAENALKDQLATKPKPQEVERKKQPEIKKSSWVFEPEKMVKAGETAFGIGMRLKNLPVGSFTTTECQQMATLFFNSWKLVSPELPTNQMVSAANLQLIHELETLFEGTELHCNMPGGPKGISGITAKPRDQVLVVKVETPQPRESVCVAHQALADSPWPARANFDRAAALRDGCVVR